ncbi:Os02g0232201 [Oryza sativa Japonica Group]|uniref:Os02g0232201 protein n=2 Tax=Oryza sativa subsp. japonica TaxID=39947 RepID=A3A4U7_ORYSJ|nr:hypothetical protein OsJ_05991 [Oryza sativa Japonica Group]BAS77788.1 Os02g0232201 [Oryza sativa Japonica Group]
MASWAAKSRVRATAGWLLSNGGDAGRCSPFDCSSSIPLPWSRGRDNGAPSKSRVKCYGLCLTPKYLIVFPFIFHRHCHPSLRGFDNEKKCQQQ